MADPAVYRDWQARTAAAKKILSDQQLALWEKVHLAGGAYAGLTLSGLQSKHRHQFLNRIVKLNHILARYQLESFDDYQRIEPADLQQMMAIILTLACPKK
jgi:hypothetical protein